MFQLGGMLMTCTSRMIRLLLMGTVLFAGCTSSLPAQNTSANNMTTVYVVRHAEKLDPNDPESPLSPTGEERAEELARTLAKSGVQKIYATIKQRTQQTVAPLAAARDLEIIALLPDATTDLVAFILNEDRGRTVVVAGHSNTVPEIVKGLSGITVDGISEEQFDRLYKVELPQDGAPTVSVQRYGAETP